ncbi:MAG: polysaccharide biosynthesis tyrosine autokinase [Actinomycetota bacterium]
MELRTYLAVLRERLGIVLLATLVTLVAGLFFSFRQTPVYSAQTRLLVRPLMTVSSSSDGSAGAAMSSQSVGDEAEFVRSRDVAEKVAADLSLSEPPETLINSVKVSTVANTAILAITAESTDPVRARDLADGFANAYLEVRREAAAASLVAASKVLGEQLQQLRQEASDLSDEIGKEKDPTKKSALTSQRDALIGQLGVLQAKAAELSPGALLPGSGGQVVQPAVTPTSPARPNHARNALLGLTLGLALGVGAAFLLDTLDEHIRSKEEAEQNLGVSVIGTIPKVETWDRSNRAYLVSLVSPKSPAAEAYRSLRTNLQFVGLDGGLKTIAITSASAGEGKTATAANLAIAMAATGAKVAVISADLRKPRLHRFFGLSNNVGTTQVLAGQASLAEAAQAPSVPGVAVMDSGKVPPNPAELLASPRFDDLLAELSKGADFVLVDCAPVLAVADASVVAPRVDGVILVVNGRTTRRGAAVQAAEQLRQVGAKIVGVVLNEFTPGARAGYRHGYGYRYYGYGQYGHGVEPSGDGWAGGEPGLHPIPPTPARSGWQPERQPVTHPEPGAMVSPPGSFVDFSPVESDSAAGARPAVSAGPLESSADAVAGPAVSAGPIESAVNRGDTECELMDRADESAEI